MLWTVHWPANGTVEDYLINFMGTIVVTYTWCKSKTSPQLTHNTSRAKSGPQCSLQQCATDRLDLPVSDEPHYRHPDKSCDHCKRSYTSTSMQQFHSPETRSETADVIIIHRLVRIASGASSDSHIKVVCDDTDVLSCLFISTSKKRWLNVSMERSCAGRTITHSTETKQKTSPNICLLYMPGRVVILCRMCLALERPQLWRH